MNQSETEPPADAYLWKHCSPELAYAIRGRRRYLFKDPAPKVGHEPRIQKLRKAFFEDVKEHHYRAVHTTTVSLAWAIIVESALLNEQLMRDMRQTASLKGVGCVLQEGQWVGFFGDRPSPEARAMFNAYVKMKWPVHVFALDPVVQEQNIQDSFSRRRELQLAMAIGVASGRVNAQSATKFARRMELDMESIDLNRTHVGFAHGSDTFGWRFYPRVQSPDTPSNATVLFRDMLWGGPSRDADLRDRRLEVGMRECVALVVTPSFVPYLNFDVRGNWFHLTHPKKKLLTHQDAMALSRRVQSMRLHCNHLCNSAHFRDGDVERLLRLARQLEVQLPLQSAQLQVPYENTLGGFE
ncbi:MAG: hypothetical protein N2C14_32985, partial [Planctomycetales bacterium]